MSITRTEFEDRAEYRNDLGQLHRHNDLPAIELADGGKSWWQNDRLHRNDGPAVEWADGGKSWWIDGIRQPDPEESKMKNKLSDTTPETANNRPRDTRLSAYQVARMLNTSQNKASRLKEVLIGILIASLLLGACAWMCGLWMGS